MRKTRPFETIAVMYDISAESAKYFLGQVQKSFKLEKPPHQLILDFIEAQEFEKLPQPYEVAAMMHESNLWRHELKSPPPLIVDDEDLYA